MFGIGEKFSINGATADDEYLFSGVLVGANEVAWVVDNEVWAREIMAGDYDIFAIWEFVWKRLPGFATHDDFVPHSGIAKELHIIFQMKDELVVFAKFVVFSDTGN